MAQGTTHTHLCLRLEPRAYIYTCVHARELFWVYNVLVEACCGKDVASQKADAGHTDFLLWSTETPVYHNVLSNMQKTGTTFTINVTNLFIAYDVFRYNFNFMANHK
jgi:hypothetical protein